VLVVGWLFAPPEPASTLAVPGACKVPRVSGRARGAPGHGPLASCYLYILLSAVPPHTYIQLRRSANTGGERALALAGGCRTCVQRTDSVDSFLWQQSPAQASRKRLPAWRASFGPSARLSCRPSPPLQRLEDSTWTYAQSIITLMPETQLVFIDYRGYSFLLTRPTYIGLLICDVQFRNCNYIRCRGVL
jgi:hypothetical protein